MIRISWRGDHLENGLESSAIEFFIYLMSVEVYGHQTEEVNVHLLRFSHSANDVWKAAKKGQGRN